MEDFLLVLVLWIDLSHAACRSLRPLELELDSSVSVGELELERSSSLDSDIDFGARADVCWEPTWCNNRPTSFILVQTETFGIGNSASNKVWRARKERKKK